MRKLSDSKQAYTPDEATVKYIDRVLEGISDEVLATRNVNRGNYTLYKPVPTGEEDPFGYKGRTVIMEQLIVSDEIQKYIRGDVEDINTDDIEKTAKNLGMLTLEQKGVLAALRGDTTLEEVARVI